MTTERRLEELEKAAAAHADLVMSASKMLPPAAAVLRPKIVASTDQVRRLRIAALQSLQQGDVHGLVRAIGVHHAFDACMTLGVGSLQALISCTRNQFALWARPQNLGWGAADAVPVRLDPGIIAHVDSILRSIGARWREPHEKPPVRLPEPVLSRAFNPNFDPKARFRIEDFSSYAHPSIVYGPGGPNSRTTIVHALMERGIYSWDDLGFSGVGAPPADAPRRTLSDLRRTGLNEGQLALVQWEMRRRGIRFHRELPPVPVEMGAIDVDKINPESIDEKDVLSFEDRIKVRDKVGNVVTIIKSENEFDDRAGAESDDVHAGYGDQGSSAMGVNEHYVEEEGEGELVQDDDDQKPSATPQPSAPPTSR